MHASSVNAIVGCLADLAPGTEGPGLDVRNGGELDWIGVNPWPAEATYVPIPETAGPPSTVLPENDTRRRLAEIDALHAGEQLLRLGWVWVVGTADYQGERRRCFLPLISRPVRLQRSLLGRYKLVLAGPWDLTPLVQDPARADELEASPEFGGGALESSVLGSSFIGRLPRLAQWVQSVVAASGLPPARLVDGREVPSVDEPAVAAAAFALYAARNVDAVDLRSGLDNWAARPWLESTALAPLYVSGLRATVPPDAEPVVSSLVLTPTQQEVVRRSRTAPVTVVSGPPGTGKSHVSVAVALDAVSRGERVLLATRSAQAADVLAGLLEQRPGPNPVLFGGSQRAGRLARMLADGLDGSSGWDDHAAAPAERARRAAAAVDAVLAGVEADRTWRASAPLMPMHRERAPGLFEAEADLGAAAQEARASDPAAARGWFARRRARRALRAFRGRARAGGSVVRSDLVESLAMARAARTAATAVPTVGEQFWGELATADDAWRDAFGVALEQGVARRVDADMRRAVAALATALRAGRARRRRHLRSVDAAALTYALPIWIGTLGDIEDLLPAEPGMFDLVVLDEASQIDQVSAAPALLRGRRAVVVGDPRQLRFVSFLADAAVEQAVSRAGVQRWADRLDLRRVSAFDLAASAAPVTMLDEHFRSRPHLIGFSARRFYDDRLTVATRHPATEARACIEVVHVAGARTADGVNRAEVDAVAQVVAETLARPGTTLGVVSPFRPQADALERMVLDAHDLEVIRAAHARVGTVHAFQGDERDVIVVSLALDDQGRGKAFLEDPNLFNVLVTRARQRMVVVTSQHDPGPGLLADYLRWAATPPSPHPGGTPDDWWTSAVFDALQLGGTPVRASYPVGRQVVDLVVGEGEHSIGVETGVHPEGPWAHRARHLALRRAGWRLVDAFPARFDGDPVAAAVAVGSLVGTER